jgi:GTP cyclohydrolase I
MTSRPLIADVEAAVRTLLLWAGDDPEREGLQETPSRVARAYREFFSGYEEDPKTVLSATFEEAGDYNDMVLVRNIRLESHCEHHLVPIIGFAHIAYLPNKRVVGLSKLARVVDIYAKRLQIQERLTSQIADTIFAVLQPRGLAVVIEAQHMCMTTRGVHKTGSTTLTQRLLGIYSADKQARREVLTAIATPVNQGHHNAG